MIPRRWGLANSHRISDLAPLGLTGEVDGYIYLGQQTPALYAKQVIASLVKYGLTLLHPSFGRLMPHDPNALAFQESSNRFPGFNYEVQGAFQQWLDGRIKFYACVVRE
jgi:hypothetical protein